ncbi:hypothetical protein [Cetobacterium sp.]|uniref:hypothetical protein n=1 Tax=Cetobacterium sp. TaxID=2071632 RepID=UPI003F2AAE04
MRLFLFFMNVLCLLRVSIPLVFWDGPLSHVFSVTTTSKEFTVNLGCDIITVAINVLVIYGICRVITLIFED